jgi:hypothetical protein
MDGGMEGGEYERDRATCPVTASEKSAALANSTNTSLSDSPKTVCLCGFFSFSLASTASCVRVRVCVRVCVHTI